MSLERSEAPPWSWSMTRRECFRDCLRRYYLHYYAYHDGWQEDAPAVARTAYRLRTLRSLPLLLGEVLHDLFADALREVRGGKPAPAADALLLAARRRLNDAYAQSKNRAAFEARPKSRVMLHEMYYAGELSDAEIGSTRQRLADSIRGFLGSQSFREAAAAPLQELKSIDREGHFELDGMRVYAAPDLAYQRGDGPWVLVDWKTGREGGEHALQLAVYALYVRSRHGVQEIAGRVEYVAEGTARNVALGPAELEAAERAIRDSAAAMRGYLAEPERNLPRGIESFPLRDDRTTCPRCNFYELCRDEIARGPEGPF